MSGRQDQDRNEVADLYDRYGGKVYGYLFLMLSSHAEAEDAMQEVFCRIWERGTAGRTFANPVGYLFRAAHNEARSRMRRRWLHLDAVQESACILEPVDAAANTMEDREAVAHALSQLPAKQREIVALKAFQDLTFAQIAQALNISPNTAASRYRYALGKLEGLLKKEGFGS
jgi:RNA polymerase sigma-70 factor (ECF subfamily)